MQLTSAQVKQAIGDLYLDNWGSMQMVGALQARVQELEAKVAELEKERQEQMEAATPPAR